MSEEPIKDKIEESINNNSNYPKIPEDTVDVKIQEEIDKNIPKMDIDDLVEKGVEQTKTKIPKYFKIDENIRKGRIRRFVESLGNSGAYAIIPLTIILIGLLFNLYGLQTTVSVDNSEEYRNMVLSNSRPLAFESAERIESIFVSHGAQLNALRNTLNQNLTSVRIPSFLSNASFTPNNQFSEFYNTSIDQTTSSIGYWEGKTVSNTTLAYAESITLFLQDTFSKSPKSLYIRAIYKEGLVQTFPYIKSNITVYNPLQEKWYNGTFVFDDRGYHFEDPYIDPITNRPVVSLSIPFLRSGALLGALQMVLDFGGIRSEIASFESPTSRLSLLSNDSRVLYDRNLDLNLYGLNQSTFNHTLTELDNSTEAIAIVDFLSGITNHSQFAILDLNETEFAIWGFKINSTDFTLSFLVELPSEPILSTFDPTQMFLLPGLATIVSLFMLLFLQLRFGLLEGKDIETILKDVLRKSRVDSLSNRLKRQVDRVTSGELIEDITESTTRKIHEKGEEIREKVSEGIEEKISAFEETIDQKIAQVEEALEPEEAEPVTEIFEKTKIISRVLDGFTNDPILYLQNKFNAKGIDLEQIRKGDFSSLKKLATGPERFLAVLTAGGKIPLQAIAKLTNIDKDKIENFLGSLPANSGIGIDEENEIVIVNKSEFIRNLKTLSPLIKEFFNDPKGYLRKVPGDNHQKIERNKEKIKIIARLLSEGKEISVQQIANVLGVKKDKIKVLFKEAGEKSGINFKFKKGKIKVKNEEKFLENLPKFSGILIEMLIMDSF